MRPALSAVVGAAQAAVAGVGLATLSTATRTARHVLLGASAWLAGTAVVMRQSKLHVMLAVLSLGLVAALAFAGLDRSLQQAAFSALIGLGALQTVAAVMDHFRGSSIPLQFNRWELDPLVPQPSFTTFKTWCDDKPDNSHCERMDDLIYAVEHLHHSKASPYQDIAFLDLRDVAPVAPGSPLEGPAAALRWLLDMPFRPDTITGILKRLPLRYPPKGRGEVRRLSDGIWTEQTAGTRTMTGAYSSVMPKQLLFSVQKAHVGEGRLRLVQRIFPVSLGVHDYVPNRVVHGKMNNGRRFAMQPAFAIEVIAGAITTQMVQRQLSPFFPVMLGVSQTSQGSVSNVVQVTEDRGTTLDSLLDTIRPHELDSVIVQAMLAIGAMNHAGITHNDLHHRNVLVRDGAVASHMQFHDAESGTYYRLPLHGVEVSIIDFGSASISTPAGTAVSHQESNLLLPVPFEAYANTTADVLKFAVNVALFVRDISPKLAALLDMTVVLNTMLAEVTPAVFGSMTIRQFMRSTPAFINMHLSVHGQKFMTLSDNPGLLHYCVALERPFGDLLRGLLGDYRADFESIDPAQPVYPLLFSRHRNLAVGDDSLADRTAQHKVGSPLAVRDAWLMERLSGAQLVVWDDAESRPSFSAIDVVAADPEHPLFADYREPFAELQLYR